MYRLSVRAWLSVAAILSGIVIPRAPLAFAQSPDAGEAPKISVNEQGTVRIERMDVPLSVYLSPEAKAAVLGLMKHPIPVPEIPIADLTRPGPAITKWREDMDREVFRPALERRRALYPVVIEEKVLAGVHVATITPKDGVSAENENRVLINLHGGGFLIGGLVSGETESIPLAGLGKITVVTVDYRQAPESHYPAATEDVVAVYGELIKHYHPKNIGIFGCSAGGILTAETVASLEKMNFPLPGAIGIFCSSAGIINGDSAYIGMALTGGSPPAPLNADQSALPLSYFANVDPKNGDAYPVLAPPVLAKFPPTLFVTASRDFEMSTAIFTHSQLVKLGVDAELHVWEGLGHGFFGEFPEIPESIDAEKVIIGFFNRHLGTS